MGLVGVKVSGNNSLNLGNLLFVVILVLALSKLERIRFHIYPLALIAIFVFSLFISTAYSDYTDLALRGSVAYLGYALSFVVGLLLLKGATGIIAFFQGMSLSVVVVAVAAGLTALGIAPLGEVNSARNMFGFVMPFPKVVPLGLSNGYAVACYVVGIFYNLIDVMFRISRRRHALKIAFFIITLFGAFVLQSRNFIVSALAFAILLPAVLVLRGRGPLRFVSMLVVVAIAGVFTYVLTSERELIYGFIDVSKSNVEIRLMQWELALHLVNENLWTGIGPGAFAEIFVHPYMKYHQLAFHSGTFGYFVDLGVLGFFSYVLLLIYSTTRFWKSIWPASLTKVYAFVLLMPITLTLVQLATPAYGSKLIWFLMAYGCTVSRGEGACNRGARKYESASF